MPRQKPLPHGDFLRVGGSQLRFASSREFVGVLRGEAAALHFGQEARIGVGQLVHCFEMDEVVALQRRGKEGGNTRIQGKEKQVKGQND